MGGREMEDQASIFEYMYRDGGNFKTVGCVRLSGYDPGADATIRGCLESSNQFVAEQLGIPSLCREHWEATDDGPSDLDHAFNEFIGLRLAKIGEVDAATWGSLESLVARVQVAAGKWDVRRSPNWDL